MRISLGVAFPLFLLAPADGVIAIRAHRLIDGNGGVPLSPAVVVVRGERIESVGADVPIPAGATVVDLGRATLLPGLVDLHTHLTGGAVHWEDALVKTTPSSASMGPERARHSRSGLHRAATWVPSAYVTSTRESDRRGLVPA
jgi:imidazolonepropionase-like amidohydrolase